MKRFCLPLLLLLGSCDAAKFYDKTYTVYDPAEWRREREELVELRRKIADYEGEDAAKAKALDATASETTASETTASDTAVPGTTASDTAVPGTTVSGTPESGTGSRKAWLETELDRLTKQIRRGEDSAGALAKRRSELEAELIELGRKPTDSGR